jgi:3',5'-nucleoside bisphosphate phosphatase
LKTYTADLHTHTVVSPCASVEMIPPLIVREALAQGVNLIAITDHNTTVNIEAVQKAATNTALTVLPGMELQTVEEVHLLCLFDTLDQAAAWHVEVESRLPNLENNADFFGEQFVVDETGEFIRRETRLLLTSAKMSLAEAVSGVRRLGGLAIPAHVNRTAFSLIANLGFVPPDIPFDALEISRHLTADQAHQKFPQLRQYPLIQSGDVHHLADFLSAILCRLAAPTIAELKLALLNQAGRSVEIRGGKEEGRG